MIHIEVQGKKEKAFPERMFTYSYRIYDRYRRPLTGTFGRIIRCAEFNSNAPLALAISSVTLGLQNNRRKVTEELR